MTSQTQISNSILHQRHFTPFGTGSPGQCFCWFSSRPSGLDFASNAIPRAFSWHASSFSWSPHGSAFRTTNRKVACLPSDRPPMFFSHLHFGSSLATRHSMSSVKTSSMSDECSEHGWMDRERQTGNAILRGERNACTHVRQSTQFSPAHSVLSHQRPSELNLLLQQTANRWTELARFFHQWSLRKSGLIGGLVSTRPCKRTFPEVA